MQHGAAIEGFAQEWITLAIAVRGLLRPPEQQIEREAGATGIANLSDLSEVVTLKRHDHQQIGIRIPAAVAPGQGAEQNHFLRRVLLNQPLRETRQSLTGHQRRVTAYW